MNHGITVTAITEVPFSKTLPVYPRMVAADTQVPTKVQNSRQNPHFRSPIKNFPIESLSPNDDFPIIGIISE